MKAAGLSKHSQSSDEMIELRFRDKHTHISRVLVILSLLLFLGAVALLSFSVRKSLDKQKELTQIVGLAEAQGGNVAVAQEIYAIMQQLGKTEALPKDELPIFATIADATKLASQPIFSTATNGDQILFYTKAQQVFIYRPSTKMLVTKGPFSIPVTTPAPQQAAQQQEPIIPAPNAVEDINQGAPQIPQEIVPSINTSSPSAELSE